MKRLLTLFAFTAIVASSCKKDKDETKVTYMPNTANSTWTYDTKTYAPAPATGSYTLKATNQDTLINGRTYRVYNHTNAANDYYAQVGSDYYQLGTVGNLGTQRVELLYLKDVDAGTTWSENQSVTLPGVPIPISAPLTYRIVKKGYDTTINSKAYRDVTHVSISIGTINVGVAITPVTDIHFYYARGVGRIYSRTKVTASSPILPAPINLDEELLLNTYTIQ